jgi:hypothetical protein
MIKKLSIIILVITSLTLIQGISAEEFNVTNHKITLEVMNESILVNEQINVQIISSLNETSSIKCWIPADASEIKIYVNNTIIAFELIEGNEYNCDLSTLKLSSDSIKIDLQYIIPVKDLFSKTFLRNTSELIVIHEGVNIYESKNLGINTAFSIKLPETKSTTFDLYTVILISLLIILLVVSLTYGLRKKQQVGSQRQRDVESEDMLITEKKLLFDVLKEIEKLKRSDKISEDTYHKLKSFYKQQTVEIMSKLEKFGSNPNK